MTRADDSNERVEISRAPLREPVVQWFPDAIPHQLAGWSPTQAWPIVVVDDAALVPLALWISCSWVVVC